ncbi:MAG TPA: DNA polymerase III subunit delta [Deltaproteobacteria bacterium]|jgi:DNA polymerase-3 subunit delta|nr:DNA polymerase III subunit delta [Deltaproteobacteria bacterium]HOI07966.1 DNA polymerase III subunit delta [Deltaproteobacteria bacterium]
MKVSRLKDPLKSAYLFVGEEVFLIEEELQAARSLLGDGASMNSSSFQAQEAHRMDEIIGLCNTMPFLADRRLVVVRNAHKLPAGDVERLKGYLADPCPSTTLILTLEGVKDEKKFLKGLPPLEVVRFDALKGKDTIDWIVSRARACGKGIDRAAASLLADATAGNAWFIASEIEKLSLYVGDRPAIDSKDVEHLVMRSLEPPVFAFLDSLFDRKKDVAIRLCELEWSGMTELEVISRIEKNITQHYQVLVENRKNLQGLSPYVEKKILGRRSLWNAQQLSALLGEIRKVEHGIKSGRSLHPYAAVHEAIMGVMFPA